MAAGDVTACAVKASGVQTRVDITIDSLTGASVTASANDILAITFAATTETYSGTTLGTTARTGIRCKYISASGSVVTVELEEPIWNDCTSITMDADAGAITDGTVSMSATSGYTVNNASNPLDYPKPTVHCWPADPEHMFGLATSSYKVYAVAVGSQAAKIARNGRFGIESMVLTVTDNSTVTETYTATGWTLVNRRDANGQWEQVPVYEFTVNPSSKPSDSMAYADAFYEHYVTAYPVTGDADSLAQSLDFRVYIDADGNYDKDVAYVDSTSDLPMDASVTGFTGWRYIKGDTSGAKGVIVGTQSGSTLVITVISGTFAAEGITEYTDLACTNASGVTGTSTAGATANASGSPAVGDINNPYGSSQAAAFALQNSSGYASHSRIKYLAGAALLGTYSFGTRFSTAEGCVIVEPNTGVTSAGSTSDQCRFMGCWTADGLRTQFVHVRGFYHDATSKVYSIPFSTASGADGTDADGEHLVVSDMTMVGTGSTDSSFTNWIATSFERAAVYNTSVDDTWEGIRGQWNIETKNTTVGQDCWSPTSRTDYIVFNCQGSCNQAGGAGAHSGYFQHLNPGANANNCIWYSRGYDDDSAALPVTCSGGAGWSVGRVSVVGSIFEGDTTPNDARLLGPCEYSNFYYYNITHGGRIPLGGTVNGANFTNMSLGNNFLLQINEGSGTHQVPRCGSFNNHVTVGVLASTTLFKAWGDTDDGQNNAHDFATVLHPAWAAQLADYANEDYRPIPTGDLVNATDYDLDYDGLGVAANGYIGALAAAAPTITGTYTVAVGETKDLTVTGTGFVDGIDFTSGDPGFTVNSTTYVSATEVTVNVTGVTAGTYTDDLIGTNPDQQTATGTVTVNALSGGGLHVGGGGVNRVGTGINTRI